MTGWIQFTFSKFRIKMTFLRGLQAFDKMLANAGFNILLVPGIRQHSLISRLMSTLDKLIFFICLQQVFLEGRDSLVPAIW